MYASVQPSFKSNRPIAFANLKIPCAYLEPSPKQCPAPVSLANCVTQLVFLLVVVHVFNERFV